jgi:hypothetical protein
VSEISVQCDHDGSASTDKHRNQQSPERDWWNFWFHCVTIRNGQSPSWNNDETMFESLWETEGSKLWTFTAIVIIFSQKALGGNLSRFIAQNHLYSEFEAVSNFKREKCQMWSNHRMMKRYWPARVSNGGLKNPKFDHPNDIDSHRLAVNRSSTVPWQTQEPLPMIFLSRCATNESIQQSFGHFLRSSITLAHFHVCGHLQPWELTVYDRQFPKMSKIAGEQ